MANTILTPNVIANEALDVLRNNAVMANLVHRDYSGEFVAGVGDTVTIRKPAKFEAKEFGTEIEVQDATESKVDVKMDKLLDVSVAVSSKEMTQNVKDFSAQFIVPAMQAFADKVDKYLLALGKDVTNRIDITAAITRDNIVDARTFLAKAAAPSGERRFVVSPDVEADVLKSEWLTNAAWSGSTDALREAALGRLFGLETFVDQNIEKDGANGAPNVVFHKNAFALVTRSLELPQGAANASIVNYDGFGLRAVYGYDQKSKTNILSFDMLCGVKTLSPELAAVIADKR